MLPAVLWLLVVWVSGTHAQTYPALPAHHLPDGQPFALPQQGVVNIYVDRSAGSDDNAGGAPSSALRTLGAAWRLVPADRLQKGYRIVLMPGSYGEDVIPEYWENRWGSATAPVIVTSQSGDRRSVTVGRINMFNCSGVYFTDLTIASNGDALHLERCVGVHLRNLRVLGNRDGSASGGDTWETIKINQAADVYIEGCQVGGAGDNAIDMVAVQYGHVIESEIYNANWCIYIKGGSAYFLVDGNTIHDCGESGFAAGQGTGLQYMLEPWVQYEAYDIHFTNNLVLDVWGAGLGVYGGYQILLAHNTLIRVGSRSHAVEFNLGSRSCDIDDSAIRCRQLASRGAWGPSAPGTEVLIPNLNVYFLNNVLYNPPGHSTQWQHLQVQGPEPATGGVPGKEVRADNGLVLAGNVFWNGGPDMPVGVSDPEGCPASATSPMPTDGCFLARFLTYNAFNVPGAASAFVVPPGSSARVPPGSLLALSPLLVSPLYAFPPWSAQPGVPPGSREVVVSEDILRRLRQSYNAIGAYAVEGAPAAPSSGSGAGGNGGNGGNTKLSPSPPPPPAISPSPPPPPPVISASSSPPPPLRDGVAPAQSPPPPPPKKTRKAPPLLPSPSPSALPPTSRPSPKRTKPPPPPPAPPPPSPPRRGSKPSPTSLQSPPPPPRRGSKPSPLPAPAPAPAPSGGLPGAPTPYSSPTPPLPDGSVFVIRSVPDSQITHIWVDPAGGSDSRSGSSRGQAIQNLAAAWERIPAGSSQPPTAYVIHLLPGTFSEDQLPLFWSDRHGTSDRYILIRGEDGPSSVTLPGIDMAHCSHVYFERLTIRGGGDTFHCADCKFLLLRDVVLRPAGDGADTSIKLNQVQGAYLEGIDSTGSPDYGLALGVDYVAVQYGHILNSKIHSADWCLKLKGGSAYLLVDSNEIYDCGSSGVAVGQGAGFEYLAPPWIQYEAYDIRITNNILRDVYGAGLGTFGGYNVLFAFNTLLRVGARSHALEVHAGTRVCTADPDAPTTCAANWAGGGWGPRAGPTPEDEYVNVPARNVMFVNNLLYNPAPYRTQWSHVVVDGPQPSRLAPRLPAQVAVDNGLLFAGNVIWNGGTDMPLGIEGDGSTGCAASNPTCNPTQFMRDNLVNTLEPQLVSVGSDNLRPAPGGRLFGAAVGEVLRQPLPSWVTWDAGNGVPAGRLANLVAKDAAGRPRGAGEGADAPGALV